MSIEWRRYDWRATLPSVRGEEGYRWWLAVESVTSKTEMLIRRAVSEVSFRAGTHAEVARWRFVSALQTPSSELEILVCVAESHCTCIARSNEIRAVVRDHVYVYNWYEYYARRGAMST